jgi:hypothetical protein
MAAASLIPVTTGRLGRPRHVGDDRSRLQSDLERMRQLAAALSWSDPLGQELLALAEGLLDRLEGPSLRVVDASDRLAATAA